MDPFHDLSPKIWFVFMDKQRSSLPFVEQADQGLHEGPLMAFYEKSTHPGQERGFLKL
jgi:hypothetical protein